MDREQFDALAKLIWTRTSRRATLATAFGAALLGHAPNLLEAKGKNKRKRKRKRKNKKNPGCYPSKTCRLGPERNNAGCNFEGAIALGNHAGSSFRGANLTGAQMSNADLRDADLGNACLVSANLLNANLEGANLDGAIFCHTTMPDGSTNDSGCGEGTSCCPTGCQGELCPTECIEVPFTICSWPFGNPCCPGLVCTPLTMAPFITQCQFPCDTSQECRERFGGRAFCGFDVDNCLFLFPKGCCMT